jgi:hypothetical protein
MIKVLLQLNGGHMEFPESYLIKDGIIIKKYTGPLNKTLFNEINFLTK